MGNLFFVKSLLATLGKKTSIFLFNQPGKGKCWCAGDSRPRATIVGLTDGWGNLELKL